MPSLPHNKKRPSETRLKSEDSLRQEIGGNFEAVGNLEHHLLRSLGLNGAQTVIDVGCGCGRLAAQLAPFPEVRYLGCDVNQTYLRYAQKLVDREDWMFSETQGARIPFSDGIADYVCFFSVFTHILHEDSYRYLLDAHRVAKPEGHIVFSFLEFRIPSHWDLFERSVASGSFGQLENQFIDRDAIRGWAIRAGFEVIGIWDGDKPHFPIPGVVVWDGGQQMKDNGNLGQSVAVLKKSGTASQRAVQTSPHELQGPGGHSAKEGHTQ
jgi:SAM-dependent methyltransferase